jgi:hypothetical protein
MSKRCALDDTSSVETKAVCRVSMLEPIVDQDDVGHANNMAEWESVQEHVSKAMDVKLVGMISHVDVGASYKAHKDGLKQQGYAFGTYKTHRSLFEKLDADVFQGSPYCNMRHTVFHVVKTILQQINAGSKPKKDSFSMLVMMSTEYVTPLSNLIMLLSHESAIREDLDLFWELTDRLWCFAHPVYHLHSGLLDETCDKITARLTELAATPIA